LFVLEGGEHLSQQVGELDLFFDAERSEEGSFVGQMGRSDLVDELNTSWGELDEEPAAVLGIWLACDETAALEAVEVAVQSSGLSITRFARAGAESCWRGAIRS